MAPDLYTKIRSPPLETYAMKYRSDIDGLRAIAIVAVVAYHAGIPGVQGGFVGVDIFFVISGYLISRLLIEEIARSDSIDLLDFYARRIRRLFPALFVVVIATLIAGAAIWTPLENLSGLADSAIATATYLSNIYFWKNTGYFELPANEAPLLHTWSLAVEEQFYIIWPLLALTAVAASRRRNIEFILLLTAGLLIILAISFGISFWGTQNRPVAAFYLMPTRAWEFALGGLVAVLEPKLVKSLVPAIRRAFASLGLLAIGASIFLFTSATPFPGSAALLPALGTACVIAGGTARSTLWPARLLGASTFVRLGKLSYSWYLWHWPLLTFLRIREFNEPTILWKIVVSLLALCLAWVTYRYVEQPIRLNKPGPFRKPGMTIGIGVVASCVLIGGAFGLKAFDSYLSNSNRFSALLRVQKDWAPLGPVCHQGTPFSHLVAADKCWQGSALGPKKLVIWGDSHADTLVPVAAHFGTIAEIGVLQRTMTTCPPILNAGVRINGKEVVGCEEFNKNTFDEIGKLSRVGLTGVILVARWSIYVNQRTQFPEDQWTASFLDDDEPVNLNAVQRKFEERLRNTLTSITAKKLRVLVVAPLPELRYPAPRCLAHNSNAKCSVYRSEADAYRRAAIQAIRNVVSEFSDVHLWDPIDMFCDRINCLATYAGLPAYYDNNHISATTSRALLPSIEAEFQWLAANKFE